jgi:hypothetical protein
MWVIIIERRVMDNEKFDNMIGEKRGITLILSVE